MHHCCMKLWRNGFVWTMVSHGILMYSPLVTHQFPSGFPITIYHNGNCGKLCRRAAWQIILESRHRRRFARFDSGNSSSDGSKSLSASSSSAFLLPGSICSSGMSKHRTKDLILPSKHVRSPEDPKMSASNKSMHTKLTKYWQILNVNLCIKQSLDRCPFASRICWRLERPSASPAAWFQASPIQPLLTAALKQLELNVGF